MDEGALLALRPTHLIVNKDENEKPLIDRLAPHIPHILVTHPITVEDNLRVFDQFVGAFSEINGVTRAGENLSAQLRKALDDNLSMAWPAETVRYLIWKNPWMSVASNTYIAAMLATVGWQTASGPGKQTLHETGAQRYPVLDEETLFDLSCERILLSSEPYRFQAKHVQALQTRLDEEGCATSVHLVDGEMCSWYGPRAIQGLRYLRQLRLQLTDTEQKQNS